MNNSSTLEAICHFLTQSYDVWTTCSIVLFIATYLFLRVIFESRKLNRAINTALNALTSCKEKCELEDGSHDHVLEDSELDWDELHEKMSSIQLLREDWQDYSGKVLLAKENLLTHSSRPVRVALKSSREFFNEESVIELQSSLPQYQDGGNSLIGFGILFTFIGLASGIYLANNGLAAGTSGVELNYESFNQLKESLSQLLGGAGQAFATSVIGIFGSLILKRRSAGQTDLRSFIDFILCPICTILSSFLQYIKKLIQITKNI